MATEPTMELADRSDLALARCFELVEEYRSVLPESVHRLLAEESESANTQRAYRADLKNFLQWCERGRHSPLPCTADVLAEYLVAESTERSLATVRRRAAAVGWLHRQAGFLGEDNPRENPLVRETLVALARRHRGGQKQAKELGIELMRELVTECRRDPNELLGLRNRAMVLVGFASGLLGLESDQDPFWGNFDGASGNGDSYPEEQDRPGGPRPYCPACSWAGSCNLSGSCLARLACGGRDRGGMGFPACEPGRKTGIGKRPFGKDGHANDQRLAHPRRCTGGNVFLALVAFGLRLDRSREGRVDPVDQDARSLEKRRLPVALHPQPRRLGNSGKPQAGPVAAPSGRHQANGIFPVPTRAADEIEAGLAPRVGVAVRTRVFELGGRFRFCGYHPSPAFGDGERSDRLQEGFGIFRVRSVTGGNALRGAEAERLTLVISDQFLVLEDGTGGIQEDTPFLRIVRHGLAGFAATGLARRAGNQADGSHFPRPFPVVVVAPRWRSEMLLPLVAHFMGEGLQQLQIAGVGQEVPGVQTDLVFPRRPVPGDEALGFVIAEMLAFVLEGQDATTKPAAEQRGVEPVIAIRQGDVIADVFPFAHE